MRMLTLQRQAPVAPRAAQCRLCEASIADAVQDHLLAGPPGLTRLEAAICPRCGAALSRLAEVFGPELCLMVQERGQAVDGLIGGPAVRSAAARSQAQHAEPVPAETELERTRQHLADEADRLAHTQRALRADVEKLARLCA